MTPVPEKSIICIDRGSALSKQEFAEQIWKSSPRLMKALTPEELETLPPLVLLGMSENLIHSQLDHLLDAIGFGEKVDIYLFNLLATLNAQQNELESLRLKKSGGWISVSERLPDFDIDVLFYDSETGVNIGSYDHNDGLWWSNHAMDNAENVTHWQPLFNPSEAFDNVQGSDK